LLTKIKSFKISYNQFHDDFETIWKLKFNILNEFNIFGTDFRKRKR